MSDAAKRDAVTIAWAKKLARIADGDDAGWGVFADYLAAYWDARQNAERDAQPARLSGDAHG